MLKSHQNISNQVPRRAAIHGIQHLHTPCTITLEDTLNKQIYMLVNFEVIGVASENYLRANDVWKLDNLLKYRIAAWGAWHLPHNGELAGEDEGATEHNRELVQIAYLE
ncbi:protease [Aspergillus luchuensis]|uniref:Protease n=1 Tax=Aspergillus kawachii TaxID=1069201 RepID=A0A146F4L3_ASPKA|nr:protease [Aspergillus luchuensis]